MLFCLEGCCGERRPLETERFQKRRIFLDRVGLIENNSMRKLEGFVHLIGSGVEVVVCFLMPKFIDSWKI